MLQQIVLIANWIDNADIGKVDASFQESQHFIFNDERIEQRNHLNSTLEKSSPKGILLENPVATKQKKLFKEGTKRNLLAKSNSND